MPAWQVGLDSLPEARRALYDPSRASKIYQKDLVSGRMVDAQELFWDPPLDYDVRSR